MSNDLDYMFRPIVLVTGFGPFANHPVNASWEAVRRMDKDEIERKHNVEFVPMEISVTYDNVDEYVPALWETYEPQLMIHVGVSSVATCITLEKQAHRKGYKRTDYCDQLPENHTCPAEGAIRMHTRLDVERICEEFNDGDVMDTSAVTSLDAGRYLCEYIYYTSLTHDNTRTLFVHVPDMAIYPSDVTAKALEKIIELCLDQIRGKDKIKDLSDKLDDVCVCADNNVDKERSLQNSSD
ncbi:unnamed protein product [Plutella xylostella]|uniref:(diamondback moth) hypothetical protein n=1 Tax=Plutella xylostella TaxID=51655 RepID=A0A8S4FL99_PLUXY|nr:unnamed protein product [Plutella xylostella]